MTAMSTRLSTVAAQSDVSLLLANPASNSTTLSTRAAHRVTDHSSCYSTGFEARRATEIRSGTPRANFATGPLAISRPILPNPGIKKGIQTVNAHSKIGRAAQARGIGHRCTFRNGVRPKWHLSTLAVASGAALTTVVTAQFCPGGYPQANLPLECGGGIVTCFSGFLNGNPAAGTDPAAFVVALVDFRDPAANAPGTGQHWCAPMTHNEFPVTANTWNAGNLGQVFGVTLDSDNPPNIYVTATTTYGSDNPSYQNGNTVALPAAPFGPGGAGAIYCLDGTTGAISVFATLPNTGPGLGNICFDRSVNSFYVSNFEDGRIYRLSAAGACLSTFDHVSDTVGSCAPEAGDPLGFVPLRERVWAVKTFGGRLYYGLWVEDRGRPNSSAQNEVWSVALNGAGDFIGGTSQLEISVPSFPGELWSNPVSDISFSSVGRMMIAERNMLADVGAGARQAWGQDGHRSRNLEYELSGSTWVPSGRDFFIGASPSGPGTNASGGLDYDCEDNLWSTGDQLLIAGNPLLATYGLQWTPEAGNTIPTIATTGYFIDLDGISTVQSKNRIGDVAVYNACCTCMTAEVASISCDIDPAGLPGKFTITMAITNNSGVPASYVLLPNTQTQPHIIPLVPPLPSGTGEVRTVTFQLCDLTPGTTYCFDVLLADADVEECCTVEVCVDLPGCDCLQFTQVQVICDPAGGLTVQFQVTNLTPDVIAHVFVFPPTAPDPNAGITITPNYFDLTGSPIPPLGTASIGPISIAGAVPGSTLCLLVSGHNADLLECCSDELCFTVPDCGGTGGTGACCLPDGTCVVVTLTECQLLQGLYIGDGAPCSECDMQEPVGACCFPGAPCQQLSLFECGNLGGIYIGDGLPCSDCDIQTPTGACCQADGTCAQTSQVNCEATGGVYLGNDTSCDDCPTGPVDGACCIPGGCIQALQQECLAQGGTWLGGGTSCNDCPTGPVDGACCIPGGCIQALQQECLAQGGTWLGGGTSCNDCPTPLTCPGDTNGDGVVNVSDLINVVLDFGTDGSAHGGDVDENDIVDVTDIIEVILHFGDICRGRQ